MYAHQFNTPVLGGMEGRRPLGIPPTTIAKANLVNDLQPRIVRLRVCDLRILSGSPSPVASATDADYFSLKGLSVVLRCGSRVHRTACLRDDDRPVATLATASTGGETSGVSTNPLPPSFATTARVIDTFCTDVGGDYGCRGDRSHRYGRNITEDCMIDLANDDDDGADDDQAFFVSAARREALQGCLVWDELFEFPLSDNEEADDWSSENGGVHGGSHAYRRHCTSSSYVSNMLSGNSNGSTTTIPATVSTSTTASALGRKLQPIIELELWRSTPSAERCLGHYAYCVPVELQRAWMAGRAQTAALAGLLPPLEPASGTVVDTVIPLHMASPSSAAAASAVRPLSGLSRIRGNTAESHRLGLRVRVVSHGVSLPPPGASNQELSLIHGAYAGSGLLSGSATYVRSPYDIAVTAASPRRHPSQGMLDPFLAQLLTPMALHRSLLSGPSQQPPPLQMPHTTAATDLEALGTSILPGVGSPQGLLSQPFDPLVSNTGGGGEAGILDGCSGASGQSAYYPGYCTRHN